MTFDADFFQDISELDDNTRVMIRRLDRRYASDRDAERWLVRAAIIYVEMAVAGDALLGCPEGDPLWKRALELSMDRESEMEGAGDDV
jgi:hypothetical protein